MPYLLNSQGMTVATQAELVADLTLSYQAIYGNQVDLSSSSQDGQQINIYVQAQLDVVAILLSDYNSRDANSAVGTQLDTLFWWLPRQSGTNTIQNITVVTSGATTLYGLNQTVQPVNSVQDASGNEYQLQTTQSPSGAGTWVYSYEAVDPGNITSPLNSITVPVTINLSVTSYNNPTTWTTQGEDAETDFYYRIRGLASTAIASQGFFGALYAALGIVPGASQVELYNNYLGAVSTGTVPPGIPPGIPGNCIWAIVNGSALPVNIANAIDAQVTMGCNMKGAQSYNVTQPDGSMFTIQWDFVETENIYIEFTVNSVNGSVAPNLPAILAGLPATMTFIPGGIANIGQLSTAVQSIDPNTFITGAGFSTSAGGTYTDTLTPTQGNYVFELATAQIIATPIQLFPASTSVAPSATVQFTAYGGVKTYVYSISVNGSSGSSINASTGLYAAGSAGTDTILVTDSASPANTQTASVVVT